MIKDFILEDYMIKNPKRNKRVENIFYKRKIKEKVRKNPDWAFHHNYYIDNSGVVREYSVSEFGSKYHKVQSRRLTRRNNTDFSGKTSAFKREYDLWWNIY